MSERPYLSIGEVLGLLLEEFPDITISKIRFLESQGLIEPERTASGYRKFYDADVDRLRYILREQRENYLPLKVIKDRLGDTPPTGTPRGLRNVQVQQSSPPPDLATPTPAASAVAPAAVTRSHPSARFATVVADLVEPPAPPAPPAPDPRPAAASDAVPEKLPVASVPTPSPGGGVDDTGSIARVLATHLSRAELLDASGADGATLDELESYGLVTARQLGQQTVYDPSAATVARVAQGFVDLGIEVRHLKSLRTAAEREAGLFEQRITPLLRQRNPHAREQSIDILDRLVQLGGEMRTVMVEQSLRQYLDPR